MSTRILLADDHKIVRDGLRSWLESQPDLEVVGEAGDGRTAAALARELEPDVVVMDVGMPDLNGIEATRKILKGEVAVKVIGLSMHADHRFVGRMLQAGASGYLLKDCAVDELAEAIRTVMEGRIYLSKGITGVVVDDYVRKFSASETSSAALLSDREKEVLQLLVEGKTTKQVAMQLHVSAKTVETHRSHIMEKLKIHSLPELTKFAIREGLTSLEG